MKHIHFWAVIAGGLLVGCEPSRNVTLNLVAVDARGEAVRCDRDVALSGDQSMKLKKLRFYLHQVELRDTTSKRWVSAKRSDGRDGVEDVWLIDLDDAECDPEYSPETIPALSMVIPKGNFDALRFKFGVPESLNHQDPLKAPDHLNQTSMHWGWQAGYRFMRVDGKLGTGESYAVHLGSTKCRGEVGTKISCERSNRPNWTFEQSWFVDGRSSESVTLDLGAFFKGIDWKNVQGCMGEPEQWECRQILENLGVEPETGVPRKDSVSLVFKASK